MADSVDKTLDEKIAEIDAILEGEMQDVVERFGQPMENMVQQNTFIMHVNLKATVSYLIDKNLIDSKEFELHLKETMLEEFKMHKRNIEDLRRRSIVAQTIPTMDIIRKH